MLFISMSAINNIITTCTDFVRRPENDIQYILFKHIATFRDLISLTFLFHDLQLVLISTGSIIKLES